MDQPPASLQSTRIGLRECTLLTIAAGFAALMLDLPKVAVMCGVAVVVLWLYGLVVGPRPTSLLTITYGAGLFVTTFWWPRENWWQLAITLMWVGVAMMLAGAIRWLLARRRGGHQP